MRPWSGTGHAGLKVYPWKFPFSALFCLLHPSTYSINRFAYWPFLLGKTIAETHGLNKFSVYSLQADHSQPLQVEKDGTYKHGLEGTAKCIQN